MTDKKQLKTSFYVSGETLENYNKITTLMTARGIEPHRNTFTSSEVVAYALDNFFSGNTGGGRKKTGTSGEIIMKIHDIVTAQIELNKTTTKTVTVGRGKNAIDVKYEQRSITDRFIRDSANVHVSALEDYLKDNQDMIASHNEWLVKNCGYAVDNDTDEAIKNFNRRTAKAQKRAIMADNGDIE